MNFFLLLVSIVWASPSKELLRGFLSGFQNTEVQLGEDCLSSDWMLRVETDLDKLVVALKTSNYLALFTQIEDLGLALASEVNDCHVPDFLHIVKSLQQVSLSTKAFRFIVNYHSILNEIEEADSTNRFVVGYHIGKAFSYLEKEDSFLPDFKGDVIGNIITGFINAIVPHSEPCANLLTILNGNFKQLFDYINDYLRGDVETIAMIEFEFMKIMSNVYQIKNKCNAVNLPGKIYHAFFTKEGLVASYIKFGVNLEKIKKLKQTAITDFFEGNFEKTGEEFGNIFNIFIK